MSNKKQRKRFIVEQRRQMALMKHPEEEIVSDVIIKEQVEIDDDEVIDNLEKKIFGHGFHEIQQWHPFATESFLEETHRDSYERQIRDPGNFMN